MLSENACKSWGKWFCLILLNKGGHYFLICSLKQQITGCYDGVQRFQCFYLFNNSLFFTRWVWTYSARFSHPLCLPQPASFICPCVTVQLQCASQFPWEASLGFQRVGEDFCLASQLFVAYLNHAHSCHSSYCQALPFNATLLHFVFLTKKKRRRLSLSVTKIMTDREMICLNYPKIALKNHCGGPATKVTGSILSSKPSQSH